MAEDAVLDELKAKSDSNLMALLEKRDGTDSKGVSNIVDLVAHVVDTTPPALSCPLVPQTECVQALGTMVELVATAVDACSATVEIENDKSPNGSDASGSYPLGTTPLTFIATDASGNRSTCKTDVVVVDTAPPRITSSVSPAILWPPNRRMVRTVAAVNATDSCSAAAISLFSISSSEPDGDVGVGDRTDDIQEADYGTADLDFLLRAERAPNGAGRTYTITYRAVDTSGNVSTSTSTVLVPHDLAGLPDSLRRLVRSRGRAKAWEPRP